MNLTKLLQMTSMFLMFLSFRTLTESEESEQPLIEFLNTQLIKEISKEPEVRPQLMQTNLLKKNPNFERVVELWNFLDSYKRKGFEVVSEEYNGKMTDTVQQDVYFAMGFQHFTNVYCYKPGTSFNP